MANHSLAFCARPPRLAPRSSIFGLGPSAAFGSKARSGVEAKAAKKSAFDLKLEKYDAAVKIKIIKEMRMFMDLGLKEAKELVEKVPVWKASESVGVCSHGFVVLFVTVASDAWTIDNAIFQENPDSIPQHTSFIGK
ncbi:50s ribosomal protein l7/l12 [Quercus suber]|uniref:50s ribosomal protein l7/l12 n=1 Tax=Quercus suber TaxID=58331 RepID=A0AAW0L471_QUESU